MRKETRESLLFGRGGARTSDLINVSDEVGHTRCEYNSGRCEI
jgi:hypothetical protein